MSTPAAQPFVLERSDQYMGTKDFLLVVRSREASIELTVSPQDPFAAQRGHSIGLFRAPLPPAIGAKMTALLPSLLAPMPASAGRPPSGPPGVFDAPTSSLTVEQAGIERELHAPETHDPSPELLQLLGEATVVALEHPVAAIQVAARETQDGFLFEVHNVGSAPVTLSHPLALRDGSTGLFVVRWSEPPPGVSPLPPDRYPLAFRDTPADPLTPVTLKPDQRLTLPSVASKVAGPRAPNENVAVVAQWSDRGTPGLADGVFRVRGCAMSAMLEIGGQRAGKEP